MRLLLLIAAVVLVTGCGGGAEEVVDAPPVPSGPAAAPPSPSVELAGTTLEGGQLSLADLRGRPVFVNVWSSW